MRKVIPVLIAVVVVGVATAIGQATFRGNIAHTGSHDSPGPSQFNGVKWSFKTEGPILGSPAIANGVVFVGSLDNNLYAVDQLTGTQKWKFKTDGPISSSPAVADGLVYFSSHDGVLYAVAAESGVLKWVFASEGGERRFEAKGLHGASPASQTIPDPYDLFTSSPAVFSGRVYFGSGDGNVYCLDALTGVMQWKFATRDVVRASPAIANNTVYIGSLDSNLYALDAETGSEKWRFKAGDDPVDHNQVGFQSSPAVVDGTVYVGCRDAHVYAIDATTGRKKWDYYTRKSWVTSSPAVRDGVVYSVTADTHLFHALDAKTGRLRLTFDARAQVYGSAAIAGELAYVGAINGRLYAINIKTGKLVWEFQTESSRKDPLKVLNPDGTRNRAGFAPTFFDFQDMYITWFRNFSVGAIVSSPVIDHGEIYLGSTDGVLYVLK
jgi:outer membrane protein assembly factor BamB